MTDRLYGNQGAPILITSAPSPQLPCHLSEGGPKKRMLCFCAMEAGGENGAASSSTEAVGHLAALPIGVATVVTHRI